VGISLGGIVNNKKGIIYWPREEKNTCVYISLPLKDYLEKKFNLPVIIENDANSCAFAEYKTNFSKYKNILYLFGGIGCGIIIDGKIYHGKDGGAGEIFLTPKPAMSSFLGDFSFFKPWPFDLGVIKRAKELISMGKETTLIKRITPTGELFLKDIFEEAKNKDRVARQILKEAGFCLGTKIALLINLFNPEVVVIGGGWEEAGTSFLDECLNAIKSFSFSEMRKNLKITLSSLGKKSTSLGVALLVKEKFFT
jgi:glucokinase